MGVAWLVEDTRPNSLYMHTTTTETQLQISGGGVETVRSHPAELGWALFPVECLLYTDPQTPFGGAEKTKKRAAQNNWSGLSDKKI